MTWGPIADGALRDRAWSAIDVIAAQVRAAPAGDELLACDLMRGDVGRAVFLAYLGQARDDDSDQERAAALLERAAACLPAIGGVPQFHAGYCGTAWAIAHLLDEDAALDAIDDALGARLDREPGWEWLDGVAGWAVYALERDASTPLLGAIVARLAALGQRTAEGVRWRCPETLALARDHARFPDGCYPLDPAHGALGPIGALAGAAAAGVADARPLLDDSVRWLLAQQLDGTGPLFPCFAGERGGGLGWCNGDPGVAGALFAAARAAGEPAWEAPAIEAARRTCAGLGEVPIDASLCHGHAGVAHILGRIGRATCDAQLLDGARRALDAAIAQLPLADASVLTGAAGVGLALLAAVAPVEPAWDRALLLSHREGDRG